jgi:hypothetical protein
MWNLRFIVDGHLIMLENRASPLDTVQLEFVLLVNAVMATIAEFAVTATLDTMPAIAAGHWHSGWPEGIAGWAPGEDGIGVGGGCGTVSGDGCSVGGQGTDGGIGDGSG